MALQLVMHASDFADTVLKQWKVLACTHVDNLQWTQLTHSMSEFKASKLPQILLCGSELLQ